MGIDGITPGGPEEPVTTPPPGPSGGDVVYAKAPKKPDGPSTFLVVKTDTCPFCKQAMEFLGALHEQRGDFQVAVMDAGQQREAFQQLAAQTRRTTVPQIFLDGGFVGGWDELAQAAKTGRLDAYLDGEPWPEPAPRRSFLDKWRKGRSRSE